MKLLAIIVLVMIVMVLWFICAAAGYESDLDFKEEPEKEIKERAVINLETMEVEDVFKDKQTGQGNEAEL